MDRLAISRHLYEFAAAAESRDSILAEYALAAVLRELAVADIEADALQDLARRLCETFALDPAVGRLAAEMVLD
jgi:hypothetical protein